MSKTYKQYFNKENGEPELFSSEDTIPSNYTDVMPEQGLYRPVSFKNGKWVGTSYEEWKKKQPSYEPNVNEKDILISELMVKVLELEEEKEIIKQDLSTLTLQVLEGDK